MRVGGTGSFVSAVAAVVASVALSLLLLHPAPEELLPWSMPAERGHVGALVLPARHSPRVQASTQVKVPFTAPAEIVPSPSTAKSVPSGPRTPTPPPRAPARVAQPVTTAAPPPPVIRHVVTSAKGRWNASAEVESRNGAAAKQSVRTQKGKPPWAGGGHAGTGTTQAVTSQATPVEPNNPPGQVETKTPPGQAKKAP